MASVQELIAASQAQKSPFISLLEGAAGGFGKAQDNQYENALRLIQIDQQRLQQEEAQRVQQYQAQQRQIAEQQTNDALAMTGENKTGVTAAEKLHKEILVDEKGNRSYSYKTVEPKVAGLEELLKAEVDAGRMTIKQAYEMKNRSGGGISPELIFNMEKDRLDRQDKKEKAAAEVTKEVTSKETALNMYETARDGLLEALDGTVTGPILGRLPAVSEGQQVADGAVASMVPVLKQLFRSSGEGAFSDKEQAALLAMVSTRANGSKAAKEKFKNIDNIIKAKLGLDSGAATTEAPGTSKTSAPSATTPEPAAGKVRVSNGVQTFEIPASKLGEA